MKTNVVVEIGILIGIVASVRPVAGQQEITPPPPVMVTSPRVIINNGPGDQTDPHVSGDLAAYTDVPSVSVRFFRFSTGIDQAIPQPAGASDSLSDVSGNRIVFTRAAGGCDSIVLFDVASGSSSDVDATVCPQRFAPFIGGNTVAYIDFATGVGVTFASDLRDINSAVGTVQLSSGPGSAQNPRVAPSGNVVVWEQCSSLTTCDIMAAVLDPTVNNWNSFLVTTSASNPDTDGTWIVYDASRAGNPTGRDIYFKPVAGDGVERQLVMAGEQSNASIRQGVMTFEQRPDAGAPADIFLYVIASNTLYQVTNTPTIDDRLTHVDVLPNGDIRVVWIANDGLLGDYNVYATTFTPALLYATGGGSGPNAGLSALYNIDPYTGAATVLFNFPDIFINAGGLAYDSATDLLYSVGALNSDTGTSRLFSINRFTGQVTTFPGMDPSIHMKGGPAIDPLNGVMYATGFNGFQSSALYSIDKTTGAPTFIGQNGGQCCNVPFGFNMNGLGFRHDGTLFANGFTLDATTTEPAYSHLFTIDLGTGAATDIGSHGVTLGRELAYSGLAFRPDGTLLSLGSVNASSQGLYSVDPATGAATVLGPTGINFGVDGGLAFAPSSPAVSDSTPPTITCAAPDGLWHAADVALACTATDAQSGLANPADASFTLMTHVPAGTETNNATTDTRQVCDKAGNCAVAGPIAGNMIDKKPPSIMITAPAGTYILNQPVAANYSCADGGSGVSSCAGPAANGASINTSVAGPNSFTVNAADNVGNVSVATANYIVTYNVGLLYTIQAKQSGSTYPIKLQLVDASGRNVSSSSVVVHAVGVIQVSTSAPAPLESSGNANPDLDFRFDPTLPGYVFNLSLSGYQTGTYYLQFTAGNDPTIHNAQFQVR